MVAVCAEESLLGKKCGSPPLEELSEGEGVLRPLRQTRRARCESPQEHCGMKMSDPLCSSPSASCLSLVLTSGRKLPGKMFTRSFYERSPECPGISERVEVFSGVEISIS